MLVDTENLSRCTIHKQEINGDDCGREGTMSGVTCAMTCCVLIVDGEECDFTHLHRKL